MEITEEKKSIWGKNENDGIMPHNGSVLNSLHPSSPGLSMYQVLLLNGSHYSHFHFTDGKKSEDLNIKPFGQDNTAVR